MILFHNDIGYAIRMLMFLALRQETAGNGSGFISAASLAGKLVLPLNSMRRIA